MKSSSVERDELFSCCLKFDRSSIPDRGRKVIPPARSGDREYVGWFYAENSKSLKNDFS